MMMKTWGRAETIVEEGELKLLSFTPGHYHFIVKQRKGNDADVFYKVNPKTLQWEYSCSAVSDKKDYGCVMFKGDQTKPFCSHTLACKIWLKKQGLI